MWIKDGVIYNGGGIVLDGVRHFNPSPEQFIAAGYEEYVPPTPTPPDMTAFNAACEQFRAVCKQIATVAELPNFKGGFDEMGAFQQSAAFASTEGIQLAIAWSAANDYCVYEGAKVGLGQPEWWYKCWEDAND